MLYGKFRLLAANPLLGETRHDLGRNLRSFVAKNYVVVYRVRDAKIKIVRVLHAAQYHALFGV